MDKKGLILTTAKDILIAYKLLPAEKERESRDKIIAGLGDLLGKMAKEVEKVYAAIPE